MLVKKFHGFRQIWTSRKKTFKRIYDLDLWNGGSGPGSTPQATVPYRNYLQQFIDTKDIKSIVDLGCGDWQFTKLLDFSGVSYIGFDIVESVIRKNSELYGKSNIRFYEADLVDLKIPKCDLIISKDVFQHLSASSIEKILANAVSSGRYLLITNDISQDVQLENSDTFDGGYRVLDLSLKPFEFKVEKVLEWNADGFLKRTILILGDDVNA